MLTLSGAKLIGMKKYEQPQRSENRGSESYASAP